MELPQKFGASRMTGETPAQQKRALLGLGMPRVMQIDALRQEPLAAALAATRQGGPPALRAHARPKAMLTFAGAFGRLVGAFHKPGLTASAYLRKRTELVNALPHSRFATSGAF